MNAIRSLLERVVAELGDTAPIPTTPAVSDDPNAPGKCVELSTPFLDPVRGRIAFIEDGWIYWAGEDGHVHASRADVITRNAA